MRVLVFGSQGMLGSALASHLEKVGVQVRGAIFPVVDVARPEQVEWAFKWAFGKERPDVAVNCAGIVKSECARHEPERVMAVNRHAPHIMADIARAYGARLVHVSTDCVFSGRRGNYCESDPTDAEDLYGQSKAAGEISDRPDCLTLRTSFIGRDVRRQRGLLEWLRAQKGGIVPGYVNVRWSGLSAPELARAITLAMNTPNLSGLYHVAGPSITKADLLEVLVREMGLGCRVDRVDEQPIDRTLDGSRFVAATGYDPPGWAEMARELV